MNHIHDTHDIPSDDELDLQQRIADLVAGDLDEAAARELREAMAEDPKLQNEHDFWSRIHAVLPDAAHPHTVPVPGPGMARILRAKLAQETSSVAVPPIAPARPWWSWAAPWAVAAAAVFALVVVLASPYAARGESPQQVMVYDEYGEAFALPSWEVDAVQHRRASNADEAPRAWMGLLTRPIELRGFEQERGLEVVRMADDSPAARAGLQARDVIVGIDDMSTATRWCLPHALRGHKPDEQVVLTYWRAGEEGLHTATMTLGQR